MRPLAGLIEPEALLSAPDCFSLAHAHCATPLRPAAYTNASLDTGSSASDTYVWRTITSAEHYSSCQYGWP